MNETMQHLLIVVCSGHCLCYCKGRGRTYPNVIRSQQLAPQTFGPIRAGEVNSLCPTQHTNQDLIVTINVNIITFVLLYDKNGRSERTNHSDDLFRVPFAGPFSRCWCCCCCPYPYYYCSMPTAALQWNHAEKDIVISGAVETTKTRRSSK